MTTTTRILAGPCVIDQIVARVIRLPNGTGRMKDTGWTAAPDGAFSLDEFMPGACRPVSVRDRARLGMPIAEF
jgi:hypothetical protein